jgi:hypothetical protein
MAQPGMKKAAIADRINESGEEINSNKLKAKRRIEHATKP